MFGFKRLLKRIKSLENMLGVSYSGTDLGDDWEVHIVPNGNIYGRMKKLDDIKVKKTTPKSSD